MRTDLLRVLKSNGMGLVLVAALALFPFALSLLSGEPVNAGAPKFWQGMLAQVFILAVYALSYDLLLGITGWRIVRLHAGQGGATDERASLPAARD